MARIIDAITGHQNEIRKLLSLRQNNRWPHAFIFAGPSGIGKFKMALAMAQTLVCENSNDACGVCGPCLRIEKMQSESLHVIQPSTDTAKPAIKVEAIRDLLESLSLSGLGIARVVIMDSAQLMNEQASNAFLKTLEEPSENIFFILIAQDILQFMPTIRSRTQAMRFSALSADELKKIKPGQPDWAYRSSRGRLDVLDSLTSQEGISRREDALSLLEQFCFDSEFLIKGAWRTGIKERSWALFNVRQWLQMCRDVLVLKTEKKSFVLNTDQSERFKKLYEISSRKLLKFADLLVAAEKEISANVEPTLVFDSLRVKYDRMD